MFSSALLFVSVRNIVLNNSQKCVEVYEKYGKSAIAVEEVPDVEDDLPMDIDFAETFQRLFIDGIAATVTFFPVFG